MHKSVIFVLGLLVILLPIGASSMNIPNANAIADYDNKADKKSVSVSSLKCNNINVNVNGLELDVFPPFLGGGDSQAPEAIDDNTGASSFAGNGGSDGGSVINDFRFICINNNNNTVIQQQPPVEECAETEDIEACFEEFLSPRDFELLTGALSSSAGLTAEINGQQVTLRSFEDICEALEGITTEDEIFVALGNIAEKLSDPSDPVAISGDLIDCIAEALGVPINTPPPPG